MVSGKLDQYLIWIHFFLDLFSTALDFHQNWFSSSPIYNKLWPVSKDLHVQQSLRVHLSLLPFSCKPLYHSPKSRPQ